MCAPIAPWKRGRTASDDAGGKSLSDSSTCARGQCVGESSTGAKSTVILDWALKTCAENFREFPVSSAHACVQSVRKNIREDMEDRWVTNLSEDRKRFYLVSSLLDPRTKMLSFCDDKYFPSLLERRCPRVSFNGLEKFLRAAYTGRSERLGWTSQAS
jgi:hypothetical protein